MALMRGPATTLMAAALIAAAMALTPVLIAAQSASPDEDSPEILPEGKGRDETFYSCVACHSTMIIRRQGMTRPQWESALVWMTERHGLPVIDEPDRSLILDYLAAKFGPKPSGRPPSPFLQKSN